MISFGMRRLEYWIIHPRIWKIDQNEWINSQNERKIPKFFPRCAQIYIPFSIHFLLIFQHKTMERKIGFSIPWKMNIFIFCSMEQNPT